MEGTGFGAGFAEGAARGESLNIERQRVSQEQAYRGTELALRAQEFERQMLVLNHQTAQQNLQTVEAQHNALMAAVTKGIENQGDKLQGDPDTWQSILSHVQMSSARLAGAMALANGGSAEDNLKEIINDISGTIQATGTPAAVSMNKALADWAGGKTGMSLGLPSLQGQSQGQKELAAAQGGGAAAAGATRAAQEAVTPRVLPNAQAAIAYPPAPPGTIGGNVAPPAVAAAMVPNAQAAPVIPPMAMPALPRTPVQSAPLPAAAAPSVAPAPAPVAPTVPGNRVPMAPATYEAESALGKNFGSEQEQKGYRGAQSGMQNLYQIMASADQLNKSGGWQNTGAGADFRNSLAKQVNSWASSFGLEKPFDANRVGSWEDLTKNTKLMGMQVISTYFGGSREAQSIVQAGISAVPGAENTPLGIRLVGSGIEQAMARQIQLHDYIANRIAANQPISTAESDFNRQNPPGIYAMRSIANAVPDIYAHGLVAGAYTPQQINAQFGPGVAEFILHGGRTGIGAAGGFPAQQ